MAVTVLDNPAPFKDCLHFHVDYTCDTDLQSPVVWKVEYLSAEEEDDQELYSQTMTVQKGKYALVLTCDPPDLSRVATADVVGACAYRVSCSYREIVFTKVGWYACHRCSVKEPPDDLQRPDVETLSRDILSSQPRFAYNRCTFDD